MDNVLDLEEKRLEYQQFFISPFLQDEVSEFQFIDLLNKIGSWPEVGSFSDQDSPRIKLNVF